MFKLFIRNLSTSSSYNTQDIITKTIPFKFFYGFGGFFAGMEYSSRSSYKNPYTQLLGSITVAILWPICVPALAILENLKDDKIKK